MDQNPSSKRIDKKIKEIIKMHLGDLRRSNTTPWLDWEGGESGLGRIGYRREGNEKARAILRRRETWGLRGVEE